MAEYIDRNLQVPNYSGVNIQIINPAVNLSNPNNQCATPAITMGGQSLPVNQTGNAQAQQTLYPANSSQAQGNAGNSVADNPLVSNPQPQIEHGPWASIPSGSVYNNNTNTNNIQYPQYPYPMPYPAYYPPYPQQPFPQERAQVENTQEQKTNSQTETKKIVVLTDEYIRSLENYLNNPNKEVRNQAANDVVKRFEEDPSRFNDPALNALLNKMLQDPRAAIRTKAIALVANGSAQGNDYTIQLLNGIQNNQQNKEDALLAAEALLRMTTRTETVEVPISKVQQKVGKDGTIA